MGEGGRSSAALPSTGEALPWYPLPTIRTNPRIRANLIRPLDHTRLNIHHLVLEQKVEFFYSDIYITHADHYSLAGVSICTELEFRLRQREFADHFQFGMTWASSGKEDEDRHSSAFGNTASCAHEQQLSKLTASRMMAATYYSVPTAPEMANGESRMPEVGQMSEKVTQRKNRRHHSPTSAWAQCNKGHASPVCNLKSNWRIPVRA